MAISFFNRVRYVVGTVPVTPVAPGNIEWGDGWVPWVLFLGCVSRNSIELYFKKL